MRSPDGNRTDSLTFQLSKHLANTASYFCTPASVSREFTTYTGAHSTKFVLLSFQSPRATLRRLVRHQSLHSAGTSPSEAQVDFGYAQAMIDGVETRIVLLVSRFPSQMRFIFKHFQKNGFQVSLKPHILPVIIAIVEVQSLFMALCVRSEIIPIVSRHLENT